MAVTATDLQKLYLAYFGRPADPLGITFYTSIPGASIWDVAASFGTSAESQALYGSTDVGTVINNIYKMLFARDADPAGLMFWTSLVGSGQMSIAGAALNILLGATGSDADAIANKLAVAQVFTAHLDTTPEILSYQGDAAAAAARSFIQTVTSSSSSVTTATANVDATIATIGQVGGSQGQTFTLTSGIDNVVGTAGNDTIVGTMDNTGTTEVKTLTIGDKIDGGQGTDTFELTVASESSVDMRTATVTNVEKFKLVDADNSTWNEVLLGSNVYTDVTLQNLDGASVYGINEGATANVQAASGGTYQYAYVYRNGSSAATVSFTDQFIGNATATNGDGEFYHGYDNGNGSGLLSAATTVNATLNMVNANSMNSDDDWTDQYIYVDNAGNVKTAVNTVMNISGVTSDGTDYSGAEQFIYQNGDAVVTSVVNISDSDSVYAEVDASENAVASGTTDAITFNMSNVLNSDYTEIDAYDFETITLNASGADGVSIDNAYLEQWRDTPTSGKVIINASGDLTIGHTYLNTVGSVAVTVSGAGAVNLGTVDATTTTLSSTVKYSIDASGTTGGFKAKITNPIQSVKGGSGSDSITLVDVSTFGSTSLGGLAVDGGAGTDTIGLSGANWLTVSGGSAADRAKIANFEVLKITDALTTATYDVSAISGIVSFTAGAGVANGATATVTNLGSTTTVTEQGDLVTNNGTLVAVMKTDTTADTLNLVLKPNYSENNDATSTTTTSTVTVDASNFETLNVTASGTASATFLGATGTKADTATSVLALTDDALASITVSGTQKLSFTAAATMVDLATFDASTNTGGVTFDGSLLTSAGGASAMHILGSATGANTLTGTGLNDTIQGGAKADVITGGLGADSMTGSGGNDTFKYGAVAESTLLKLDVITDFSANTVGQGTNGAANKLGAAASGLTGDVIDLSAVATANSDDAIKVSVQANAADAQTYLQNMAAQPGTYHNGAGFEYIGAVLDSSSGKVYIDVDHNGTVDMVIQLTGVTTLTEAAFKIA